MTARTPPSIASRIVQPGASSSACGIGTSVVEAPDPGAVTGEEPEDGALLEGLSTHPPAVRMVARTSTTTAVSFFIRSVINSPIIVDVEKTIGENRALRSDGRGAAMTETSAEQPTVHDGPTMGLATSTAISLLFGGATAIVVIAVGALSIATSSYPYAFGFDMNADRTYPFPFPEGVGVGIVLILLGIALIVGLIAAARGDRSARRITLLVLASVLVVVGVVVAGTSEVRRCAYGSYAGRHHCTSRTTAGLRDFIALSIVPGIAMMSLWWSGRTPPK